MKKTAFTKIFFLVFALLGSFVLVMLGQSSVSAAYLLSKKISTTVEVRSSDEVKVTQVHRLSWNKPGFVFPASKNYLYVYIFPAYTTQVPELEQKVSNIKVTGRYSPTRGLTFTQKVEDGALQIKVPYYDTLSSNNDLEFTVTYTTSLFTIKQGGIFEIAYPGLGSDFKSSTIHEKEGYTDTTSYEIKFIIPSNLGQLSFTYPNPKTESTATKGSTLVYSADELVGKSIRIALGKERLVKFALTGKTYATNENTPNFVKGLLVNYIDVALPNEQIGTESGHQRIYYSRIEPFPISLSTDSDGNLIARIPISATDEGEIIIEGYASLKNIPLDEISQNALISDIPKSMAQYLSQEDRYWQVNSAEIQSISTKTGEDTDRIYENIRKTLKYVSQNLVYNIDVNEPTLRRLGALEAIRTKTGVCMEYSDLTLSILRAKGIPTRAVFGDGVGARVDRTLTGIGHQWVGVWFPNQGWVPVDPTWSDSGREYIGHDFDHFVWYVASKSVDNPSGFNCLSWDSSSPCREALRIETHSVEKIPPENLFTIAELKQRVTGSANDEKSFVVKLSQYSRNYFGGSSLGRALLSKQVMLFFFAIVLYGFLLLVIRFVMKILRKKEK
ncbi:transglutaminase domain-containing protein [bacterium]|nr:transglutaminase domain-containing protein [bacterium]